jgi:DNA repair exonuclease SbcCD ATPase subunit
METPTEKDINILEKAAWDANADRTLVWHYDEIQRLQRDRELYRGTLVALLPLLDDSPASVRRFINQALAAPPPARAEAPKGARDEEMARLRKALDDECRNMQDVAAAVGQYRSAADIVAAIKSLRAEIARLTEALEQATRERDSIRHHLAATVEQVSTRLRVVEAERDQQAGALVTLRAALEKALLGIDDVAAQASLCAHHVVPHEHQRTWLRSEVRREADGAQRAIRAALAASAPAVPASTPEEG